MMLERKRAVRYTKPHLVIGDRATRLTAMCCPSVFACHVIQAEEEVTVSHKEAS